MIKSTKLTMKLWRITLDPEAILVQSSKKISKCKCSRARYIYFKRRQ